MNLLVFLQSQQNQDGSFTALTSASVSFKEAKPSSSIFLTSLILSCLRSMNSSPVVDDIKQKAARFLLSQKSDHWTFNYWKKGSHEAKDTPYPDDLDDTFCSLVAIGQTDQKILDAPALAKIVTLLTAVEQKEGGPYYTWLVPPDADKVWRDVDIAVNANVAYFLALQDIFLPNLRTFIYSKINKRDLTSKYYPSMFPVAYFLSRYLSLDKKVPLVIRSTLQQEIMSSRMKDGNWGNPLNTALAVSSLLRLGAVPKTFMKNALKGNRQAHAFCCDPVIHKKQYYAGSNALTAAFCLEAFFLFDNYSETKEKKEDKTAQKIYKEVVKQVTLRFERLGAELRKQALTVLSGTLKSDKDKQIILFPYYFATSLDKTVHTDLLIQLGKANLYGWMAYRIYDDFFDAEGIPAQLSVANVCLRELTTIYNGILPIEFGGIMDMLDNANTWEIVNTRGENIPDYGDYSQLANKSIGHALGPLAILKKIGYGADSKEVTLFLTFFRHYIIARQLNDDAHDWEEDLARGQINAAAAMVLTKTKDTAKLREVFWQEVIQEVCQIILENIRGARSALNKCGYIKNKSLLSSLLMPIEQSAQNAIDEQKEALAFMREYGKKV